jgi:spore photoproduct lyase
MADLSSLAECLFASSPCPAALMYVPRPARCFAPMRIILAKGSTTTLQRQRLAEAICRAYPKAVVEERPDVHHNQIDLGIADRLGLHHEGKRTLVLGEHLSSVRRSDEDGNTCPNYWHFSPYGFCPYGCDYCYLAGSRGVRFSPTVKIFMNLDEMLDRIDAVARKYARPMPFYLGKLQDGLALDRLTGYSRRMIPFFADHPYARMTVLTKSVDVENLLDLDHRQHTILSWTTNPTEIDQQFEPNTPSVEKRIEAMRQCAAAGYPVRAVVMPIIPIADWRKAYETFLRHLLTRVPLSRITLGGTCIYQPALQLVELKLGGENAISKQLQPPQTDGDRRSRYAESQRVDIYRHLIETIRSIQPDLPIGLCLEQASVFETLGMTPAIGQCNCLL